MKKVLIVDDAAFMRLALRNIIEQDGELKVIGEAENGIEAIKKYLELQPDLVTMDITMPQMEGLQALAEIRKIDPKAKIIIISALGQESHVKEAVIKGAKGFIVSHLKKATFLKL